MKRNCSLKDISDGTLYELNDIVEVGCDGCQGEPACCRGMGTSIVLDPFDVHRMTSGLDITFEQLLAYMLELNVVDGVILPNLKMTGEQEACVFLNPEGRCSIHAHRPGICRIFPLGRYYENHDFSYFLQTQECPCKATAPVKAGRWIDTPNLAKNKQFLIDWHYFLNEVEELLKNMQEPELIKKINMYVLNSFYGKSYQSEVDFYGQFRERLSEARRVLFPLD